MATSEAIEAANKRGQTLLKKPHAVSARVSRGLLTVRLSSGALFGVPVDLLEGLQGAPAEALGEIEVSPSGLGIHFPRLDADFYVPALLEGAFGTKAWMASEMGRSGGRVTSEAKATAARDNGKLGGRPKKEPAHA